MKGIRCFLWGELLLCGASLAGVAYRVRENYQGLSFGGFMALFLLLLLFPCFLALAGCIPLSSPSSPRSSRGLPLSFGSGSSPPSAISFGRRTWRPTGANGP